MSYPTELVEKAEYEMHVFERVSAGTGAELIAEVKRLRALLQDTHHSTHQCIHCLRHYTPEPEASEDCPYCGSDGTEGWKPPQGDKHVGNTNPS